ncbi:MAG TPA: FAD-binding protein, partial [Firmicutes bacterium]|nr:FAD-binding protein [Bacillota bacterium]
MPLSFLTVLIRRFPIPLWTERYSRISPGRLILSNATTSPSSSRCAERSKLISMKRHPLMIEKNVSLQCMNSYCLPGMAEYYYRYHSEWELADVLRWARQKKIPVRILGGGSNILLTRPLIEGLVIHMGPRFLSCKGDTLLAGSGVDTSLAVLQAWHLGLSGAEFLYGLPGNLGGALFMNARAYD